MNGKRPHATILMAVYNEASVLPQVLAGLSQLRPRIPVIAVDDGSTDGSRDILARSAGTHLRVLFHNHNRGKGAAIRTALARARTPFVLIHDADMETKPGDIPRLLRAGAGHPGFAVFGTRFPHGRGRGRIPFLTRTANRLLTGATNLLYGSRLTDMACGFKLVPVEAVRRPALGALRFEIDAEITARLLRRGVPIVEIPVEYRPRSYRQGKKIHPIDGLRILATLLKLRLAGIS